MAVVYQRSSHPCLFVSCRDRHIRASWRDVSKSRYEGTSRFREYDIGFPRLACWKNHRRPLIGRRNPKRKATRVAVDLAENVIQVHAAYASDKLITNRVAKRDKLLVWCADFAPAASSRWKTVPAPTSSIANRANEVSMPARFRRSSSLRALVPRHNTFQNDGSSYRIQGTEGKNDANDPAAVCEPAWRPCMNFLPQKTLAH